MRYVSKPYIRKQEGTTGMSQAGGQHRKQQQLARQGSTKARAASQARQHSKSS
jgi:hypothetical protein